MRVDGDINNSYHYNGNCETRQRCVPIEPGVIAELLKAEFKEFHILLTILTVTSAFQFQTFPPSWPPASVLTKERLSIPSAYGRDSNIFMNCTLSLHRPEP